jgi:hydroxymethylbilane synthase
LARHQAEVVATLLRAARPGLEVRVDVVRTRGDQLADVPLDQIGGQGIFVKEVQAAVLDGRADLAVHSAKDLPPVPPPGLVLAAVPERRDPRDALVGRPLDELGPGAVVATGSARRRAQLAALRPDLTFVELRGNMDRRLARAGDGTVGAVVAALAALQRLGREEQVAEVLSTTRMLPQVGQGALAVECRADDDRVRGLLATVDDRAAHRAVDAERALLAALGGSCSVPVAGLARPSAGQLRLEGLVATGDGRSVARTALTGDDPTALGQAVARRLMEEAGGAAILDQGGREGPEPAVGR